jgi:type IV secretory pathway TrbD component
MTTLYIRLTRTQALQGTKGEMVILVTTACIIVMALTNQQWRREAALYQL